MVFSTVYSLGFKKIINIIERYIPVLYEDDIYNQIIPRGVKKVSHWAPFLGTFPSPS